jgi:hypothetical protein
VNVEPRIGTLHAFLRSQAEAILATDLIETVTLTGMYVLAVIEHATRRVRILGATAYPTAAWVTQAVRNLAMDFQDTGCRAQCLIRDRDGKYPALFDAILTDTGIEVVLTGVRMPRVNAIMQRWIQTCRHEPLDRMLIWNQRHVLHALSDTSSITTRTDLIGESQTRAHSIRYRNQSPTQTRSHASTSADMTASADSSTSTNA